MKWFYNEYTLEKYSKSLREQIEDNSIRMDAPKNQKKKFQKNGRKITGKFQNFRSEVKRQ